MSKIKIQKMENQTELKWYQKPVGVIILLIWLFPIGLYMMWKNDLWTKQTRWIVTGILALITVIPATLTNNKTTTELCKDDVGAYEFGREMSTITKLQGGGSLSKSIDLYHTSLGQYIGYDANNLCVIRGYNDGQDYKESPFNKEGKSWTTF